ncbi:hypothetical protein Acr_25g0010160 [Actinidia rufa]|uniref:Rx N-terminal domain-containing protein n=1 Tax=Actinidia rufa TaxID=165716 RepID=A0A7J0H0I6_9ERIC|nr:hypothetical protein Acr_25g0010160 [Actinidia rufa]
MAEIAVFHLLANFAPFLQEEVNLLTGVRDEIEYIRDEFERMTAFLRVADAMEERDPELKVWVKQVRESAYDIADALDMYMLRPGHHHGNGVRGFLRKVSCYIKTIKVRHQIAFEVKRIKSRLINISEGHQRYGDIHRRQEQASRPTVAWYDSRGDALLLEEAELVGIEKPKRELTQLLLEEDPRLKIEKLLQNMIEQLFEEVKQPIPQGVENMDTNSLKGIINAFLQQKRKTFQGNSSPPYLEGLSRDILRRWDDLRLLTLLDLEGTQLETFPNEVVKLFHLRHLSLRRTNLKAIPKSIGNLRKLETLDLKQTLVAELPDEILKLQRLRHLLLYRVDLKLFMSSFHYRTGFKAQMGIGSLSSLQKLCSIEANHDNNNGNVLREVGKLTQLRRVHILKLRGEDGKVLCSSLEKLKNLRSLLVRAIQIDEIIDLDSLSSPPQHLRTLCLGGYLQRLPQWIPSAFNLVRVCLAFSKLRDSDSLRSLQDLPNLVNLEIFNAYDGEELCFKAGAFQNLETLTLAVLKELIWMRVEASSMPRLKNLSLVTCKLMEDLPSGIEHLTNLEKLQLLDMPYSLISRLRGDYWKVSHIPDVVIGGWKDGHWQGSFLSEIRRKKEECSCLYLDSRDFDK